MADKPKNQFNASLRNMRMSARKARLVMDTVRGMGAGEAMVLLQFTNKRAAPAIRKLIESAVANAEEYGNREGIDIDTDELVVALAQVNEGPRMKRWRPRSRGMANPFTRYTCHMEVTVAERGVVEEQAKGRPAFFKPRRRVSREDRLAKKGIVEKAEPKESKPVAEKQAAPEKKPTEKKPAAKNAAAKAETKTETKKKPAAKKTAAKKAPAKKDTKAKKAVPKKDTKAKKGPAKKKK
jgi:large subunit ribosomal protein L22